MTLTPTTIRADLKCGKGAISKGEKCTKGTASEAQKKPDKTSFTTKALIAGGTVAALGGLAYGMRKYNRVTTGAKNIGTPGPSGKKVEPNEAINRGRKVFRDLRQVGVAGQIGGAGLTAAGIGLVNYGRENDNGVATAAGVGLAYLGIGTAMGGTSMQRQVTTTQSEWEAEAQEFANTYYQARKNAQQREREAGQYHSKARAGSNKAVPEPYKDLGISESASDAEIKKRWLQLMRQNHPDAGGDPRKAQQVNAAYQEILRRRGRGDSLWAMGFDIDWNAIGI